MLLILFNTDNKNSQRIKLQAYHWILSLYDPEPKQASHLDQVFLLYIP